MPVSATGLTMFFGLTHSYKVVGNGLIQEGVAPVDIQSRFALDNRCLATCTVECEPDSEIYPIAKIAKHKFAKLLRAMGRMPKRGIRVCV